MRQGAHRARYEPSLSLQRKAARNPLEISSDRRHLWRTSLPTHIQELSEFVNSRKLDSYIPKPGLESVLPHPECNHRVPENGIRLQAWIRDREALAKVRSFR